MNHKTFVFFDCECANTFEGIGKICSFGYVIADDELNIIESEDVVMNPECEFDWYLFSNKGGCRLAYSKDYFRTKPNFEGFYKAIKKLLTTGNRYIAGFAVSNDVGFVNNACERYNLPYIQFRSFDLERYLEKKYEKKQKLSEWAAELGVNVSKYQSHKSVDDAIMTMLCLKAECMRCGLTAEEIITQNKTFFVSNEQILQQVAEREYRREMTEKIKRLYGKQSPMPKFKTVLAERFELDKKILWDVDYALELVKKIYDNGGATFEYLGGGKSGTGGISGCGTNVHAGALSGKKSGADAFVVFDSEPHPELRKKIEAKGYKIMLLEELESLLK